MDNHPTQTSSSRELYDEMITKATAWWKARLDTSKPLDITSEQYHTGLDALPQYKDLMDQCFEHFLKTEKYELSYNQMCRAFFTAMPREERESAEQMQRPAKSNVKIVAEQTGHGTRVFIGDKEITNIRAIEFDHYVGDIPHVKLLLIPEKIEVEGTAMPLPIEARICPVCSAVDAQNKEWAKGLPEMIAKANMLIAKDKPIETYQDRVIAEWKDLEVKIQRLYAFFAQPKFQGLSENEQELMKRQYNIMCKYSCILADRMKNFNPPVFVSAYPDRELDHDPLQPYYDNSL